MFKCIPSESCLDRPIYNPWRLETAQKCNIRRDHIFLTWSKTFNAGWSKFSHIGASYPVTFREWFTKSSPSLKVIDGPLEQRRLYLVSSECPNSLLANKTERLLLLDKNTGSVIPDLTCNLTPHHRVYGSVYDKKIYYHRKNILWFSCSFTNKYLCH